MEVPPIEMIDDTNPERVLDFLILLEGNDQISSTHMERILKRNRLMDLAIEMLELVDIRLLYELYLQKRLRQQEKGKKFILLRI